MINITRRGQWQLTRIMRVGCCFRANCHSPQRDAQGLPLTQMIRVGCCFRANCHSPLRVAKIAIDPNDTDGLRFRANCHSPQRGRKDYQYIANKNE